MKSLGGEDFGAGRDGRGCGGQAAHPHFGSDGARRSRRRSVDRQGSVGFACGLPARWTSLRRERRAPGRSAERATRPRTGAFTLTELLVVIVIIGILAGLVLSVVARGKTRTYPLVCMANLQQFAVALQTYRDDFDDVFPTAIWRPLPLPTGGVQTNISFDDLLYPYLGMPLTDAEKMTNRIPVAKRLKVLTCPADKIPAAFPTPDTWRRTYSMSEARMAAGADPLADSGDGGIGVCHSIVWGVWPTVTRPAALRGNSVPDPAKTLAIVERPNPVNYAGNDHWAVTRRTGEQQDGFRSPAEGREYHGGKFNYLFCDGRVELLLPEATWGRSGSDTNWAGAWTLRTDD